MVRGIASQLRGRFADVKFLLVIAAVAGGKPSLTVALSQPLVDAGLNANQIIREAAKEIEGNGGGQAFMATAGGKNIGGLDKAIAKAVEMVG
jgi:alanyl-tRNA synthetase